VAGQVWRDGCLADEAAQGAGGRECPPQEDVGRGADQGRAAPGSALGKFVRPSLRREMARKCVTRHGISIRLACELYGISETCYRYQARLDGENALIAEWLLRLTQTHKRWGFGLCFMHLRNVKGFTWNHKRVYRVNRYRFTKHYPGPTGGPSFGCSVS